jgi:hypothetical protein
MRTVQTIVVAVALVVLGMALGGGHSAEAQNRDNMGAHLQSIAESLRALVSIEKERNQRCK